MNENQKKTTEQYRSNFDNIFGKKHEQLSEAPQATNDDEADVAGGVCPSNTTS
jgi:hypothetical protein